MSSNTGPAPQPTLPVTDTNVDSWESSLCELQVDDLPQQEFSDSGRLASVGCESPHNILLRRPQWTEGMHSINLNTNFDPWESSPCELQVDDLPQHEFSDSGSWRELGANLC